MHILLTGSQFTCGLGGLNDAQWGASYRCVQMICSHMKKKIPSVIELLQFFTVIESIAEGKLKIPPSIDPPEMSTYLLCQHGIFTKPMLFIGAKGATEQWPFSRTSREIYSHADSIVDFDKFLMKLVKSRHPVVLTASCRTVVVYDIMKSKFNSSILIFDPASPGSRPKRWVSASAFLGSSSHWQALFVDEND